MMGAIRILRKVLINASSALADIAYRRPYFDREAKIRDTSGDEILHLDLVITECCSLKCRDCSNLMQYYQHPENISSGEVLSDLRKLLDVFTVRELKIIGGEPFVNQKTLCDVIAFLNGEYGEKVDRINIITNGTIIPSDECFESMKSNPKVLVTFSNYGELSSRQDEFTARCIQDGIRYSVLSDSFYWLDFGRPVEYKETEEFNKRQFVNCFNRKFCNTVYRGGYYVCPRLAHGMRLGLIPDDKSGYADLNDPLYQDTNELKKAVQKIIRKRDPVSACSYCINGKYIHLPRGVQNESRSSRL